MSRDAGSELQKTLYSGYVGQGTRVDEFEQALAPVVGRSTCVAVNSCTSAIQLALRLSGVGFGDEVISTPVTCTATNVPVLAIGGTGVWADADLWTGNIDPESVKHKITKKTKAVIAVHWGGTPCDVDALETICKDHGLKLIFDCAHALGATYNGKPIGYYGDFSCFSFQAIKHVTTGDGGLLVCNDRRDYERGKLLRWYGIKRPADLTQDIKDWGYKFHMNDLAATIGLANLKDFPAVLKKHRDNARFYREHGLDGVYDPESAFWLYTLHTKDPQALSRKLKAKGIASGRVHERNDRYSMFKSSRTALPGVDDFYKTMLNIPVGWWVTPKDRERIGEVIRCA